MPQWNDALSGSAEYAECICWLCARRGSEAELAAENGRLKRQLSVVMETRAAEINDDNIRLISALTEV